MNLDLTASEEFDDATEVRTYRFRLHSALVQNNMQLYVMYTVMYKYTYIQFKTYVLGENFYLIIAGASDKYTHV